MKIVIVKLIFYINVIYRKRGSRLCLLINSKNQLKEYEEKDTLKVCSNCHKIYRQILFKQIPSMREREYDRCPYCDVKMEVV